MKVIKRNRYYCDHCKKSGGSSYHLQRHESGCTLNAGRICKMCAAKSLTQHSMEYLLAMVGRDQHQHDEDYKYHGVCEAVGTPIKLTNLRKATSGCPACILAAIRQSPLTPMAEFHFQTENTAWWQEINDEKSRIEHCI